MGNITDSIIKGDMRMKNIKEIGDFFINLNEYVYATDIETNEIVYMNHKALKAYGLESIEDIKGRKCYEVLQKASVKCGMCNNSRLLPGAFEEWRYYNPVLDKYMIIKDTLIEGEGNRKYRLEIGIDISEELAQDKLIQKYRETEALVNEGLRVALAADTPDETISTLLGYIGKALSGERTYIFEKNIYRRDDNTYEWTAEGISPKKDNLQNLPPEVCANWYKCFEKGGNIVIQDIEEIKDSDPLQYDNLKRQGVHSIIAIPIYNEGNVVAFMGIGNPPLLTLKYALSILEIMSAFIISCIKRRNMMRKLEDMSYKDALTNIGNRFAMSACVESIDEKQSIGVVYCDVTGLKYVNDTMGHDAGDRLILNACGCLTDVFGEDKVFRIGGDEFLVICTQIDENTLIKRITELKELMKERSVNMAAGVIWRENVITGFGEILRESEELMYADKAQYYKEKGVERRKGRA